MGNGLNLPGVRNNPATTTKEEVESRAAASREGATSRPQPESQLPKPPETKEEVETRLDPTQPVSGDNADASNSPEETFLDPPTPAETRKDTLEGKDPNAEANEKLRDQLEGSLKDESKVTADDGAVRYSSHPIMNYKVGRFEFDNGLLTLRDDKDISEFRKLLEDPKFPRSERNRIKELDLSAAEAQSRLVRSQSPKASKAIGSDTGDRDPGKQVGKGRLEDSGE